VYKNSEEMKDDRSMEEKIEGKWGGRKDWVRAYGRRDCGGARTVCRGKGEKHQIEVTFLLP
jgi:hypothetical protein